MMEIVDGTQPDDALLLRLRQLRRLQDVEPDHRVDKQDTQPGQPPERDGPGQRLGDGRPSKLDADEKLRGHDGEHDPRLASQPVALRIVQQLERLPQPDRAPQQNEGEPDSVEPMFWK